jgi:hypothetical protein
MQILLIWPTKLITWLNNSLLPLWNAFIWFTKKVPNQLLFETISFDLGIVLNAIEALGNLVMSLVVSLMGWIQSFICCKEGEKDFCNPRCMEAGERIFDFLSPMAHIRTLFVWIIEWLRTMCAVVMGPVDLITFPLMDINFAKGLHFLLNSIIYTVFHVPALTVERCNMYKAEGPIMCVPDFEPAFNMFTSGVRYMGLFVDNWLDILVLIVEG